MKISGANVYKKTLKVNILENGTLDVNANGKADKGEPKVKGSLNLSKLTKEEKEELERYAQDVFAGKPARLSFGIFDKLYSFITDKGKIKPKQFFKELLSKNTNDKFIKFDKSYTETFDGERTMTITINALMQKVSSDANKIG